jgi:hypothetical protein
MRLVCQQFTSNYAQPGDLFRILAGKRSQLSFSEEKIHKNRGIGGAGSELETLKIKSSQGITLIVTLTRS